VIKEVKRLEKCKEAMHKGKDSSELPAENCEIRTQYLS
jgi:hypothetical protein